MDKFQRDFNALFDVRDDGFGVTRALSKLARALQQLSPAAQCHEETFSRRLIEACERLLSDHQPAAGL